MKPRLDTAFEMVQELVRALDLNKHVCVGLDYRKAQTRNDFIDKLFMASGGTSIATSKKIPMSRNSRPSHQSLSTNTTPWRLRVSPPPNFHNVYFFVEAPESAFALGLHNCLWLLNAIDVARRFGGILGN